MNMENEIQRINQRLKTLSKNKNMLLADNGEKIDKGQVWSVGNSDKTINTYLFLIISTEDKNLVNIIPVFRWTELMGPEDILFPKEFMGAFFVISFELEATVSTDELDKCIGRLDQEALDYIEGANKLYLNDEEGKYYTWGHNYLDESDLRLKYHSDIIADIEKMQKRVGNLIFDDNVQSENLLFENNTIKFTDWFKNEQAVAASDSRSLRDESIIAESGIELFFNETRDMSCVIKVLAKEIPSNALDGWKVVEKINRRVVSVIAEGHAEFDYLYLKHGILIMDKDDNILKLRLD